jgi:hypothetical protein
MGSLDLEDLATSRLQFSQHDAVVRLGTVGAKLIVALTVYPPYRITGE